MSDIVIMGAGLGGMPMALEMRELAREQDRVMVVSDRDCSISCRPVPGWAGAGASRMTSRWFWHQCWTRPE